MAKTLEMVSAFRKNDGETPIVLMGITIRSMPMAGKNSPQMRAGKKSTA